jgi:FkbM family methyltransferase
MKRLNNWWVPDQENSNSLTTWTPEQWQNYFCQFTVDFFCLNKKRLCVDIGANVGQTTIAFSPYFREVKSFEPNPIVYECLEKNIKEYNLKNVRTYNVGIGHEEGSLDFKYVSESSGKSRFIGQHETNEDTTIKSLPIKTLDSFNFLEVDLIKMDIEGHEAHALLGAKDTILYNKPTVVLEIAKAHFSQQERIPIIMKNMGYVGLFKRRSDYYYVPVERAIQVVTNLLKNHEKNNWKLDGI